MQMAGGTMLVLWAMGMVITMRPLQNQVLKAPVLFGMLTETERIPVPRPLYQMDWRGGGPKTPGGTVITLAVGVAPPRSAMLAPLVAGWHPHRWPTQPRVLLVTRP